MNYKRRTRTDSIVIHCAYTPPSMDIGVEEIDRWHRDKGWLGCGYHYVIRRSGEIEIGRPYDSIGAHVRGHNDASVGICLVGGKAPGRSDKDEDNFTFYQGVALWELLNQLSQRYPNAIVLGHRELDKSRTCPVVNLDLIKRYFHEVATDNELTRSGSND